MKQSQIQWYLDAMKKNKVPSAEIDKAELALVDYFDNFHDDGITVTDEFMALTVADLEGFLEFAEGIQKCSLLSTRPGYYDQTKLVEFAAIAGANFILEQMLNVVECNDQHPDVKRENIEMIEFALGGQRGVDQSVLDDIEAGKADSKDIGGRDA